MKKSLIKFGVLGSVLVPFLAFAQQLPGQSTDVFGVLAIVSRVINIVTIILVAAAILMFIWGVIQYISSGGDEEKQKAARSTMIYGIIGIFVIVAVWGLVNILRNTFIGDPTTQQAPCSYYVDEFGQYVPSPNC